MKLYRKVSQMYILLRGRKLKKLKQKQTKNKFKKKNLKTNNLVNNVYFKEQQIVTLEYFYFT